MKKIFFVFTILIINFCHAQDTTKVLFIGNSFTSQNDLPNLFNQISLGSGKDVFIASYMPGGVSVGDISQGTSAHMNNPLVFSLIKSNNWDYLVLQDNQGRFCLGYGQFPSTSLVIEGHNKILDSLLFYNPCAHMILFAGFGPKNGYMPYANSGSALIDTIYQNYQFLNESLGQIIAPIGPTLKKIISDHPSINLWSSDEVHPSLYGSFLTANVLYSTIFKSSPISSSYNPGILFTEDSLLKKIAFQTTIDSLNNTGLLEITPIINQMGNTISISGYNNCSWFFNGIPYVTNNCTLNMLQPGKYYAIGSDINNCKFQTLEQYFNTTNIEDLLSDFTNIRISPNPANDYVTLSIGEFVHFSPEIRVYDALGNQLKLEILIQNQNSINVSDLKNGFYLLVIKSKEISKSFKLVIQR